MINTKVAFYLDKPGLENLDYTEFEMGNPGMGGSEYEFLLVSQLLHQRQNLAECILLSRSKLPETIHAHYVDSIDAACNYCHDNGIGVFVINQAQYESATMHIRNNKKPGLVLWAHNNMSRSRLKKIYMDPAVKRVVFCGREFMELYYDDLIMRKSTYVYNIFPMMDKAWYKDKIEKEDNHNVCYMGAISPGKGFHLLAQAWPAVIKQVPDAHLYVIGSGQLYDKNAKMGQYGIAEQNYENLFMPYLVDESGNTPPSVHFLGVLGIEKYQVLGKCKVAVPNPSGISETFCITAVEMELMGCSLTSILHPAYLDTIYHQKYLYKDVSQLADYVVKRLLAPRDNYDALYNFVVDRFDTENSIRRWEYTLTHLDETKIQPFSHNNYHLKPLKSFLLHSKIAIPILDRLPSVERMISVADRIKTYIFRQH